MRFRPLMLIGLAGLLLGAAAPGGCSLPWEALIGNPLGEPLKVHVVNTAYHPVDFSLITSNTAAAARVTAAASAPATGPATQPDNGDGGSTLEPDGQYDTSIPCLTIPDVLALKATLQAAGDSGGGPSATSRMLHRGTDYTCGSEVTFTVRQTAAGTIVVGASGE